jgi:hypothetical protein
LHERFDAHAHARIVRLVRRDDRVGVDQAQVEDLAVIGPDAVDVRDRRPGHDEAATAADVDAQAVRLERQPARRHPERCERHENRDAREDEKDAGGDASESDGGDQRREQRPHRQREGRKDQRHPERLRVANTERHFRLAYALRPAPLQAAAEPEVAVRERRDGEERRDRQPPAARRAGRERQQHARQRAARQQLHGLPPGTSLLRAHHAWILALLRDFAQRGHR